MAPPKWLVEYWEKEPNWIRRYMRGSDLNLVLCGFPAVDTMWTPENIRKFVQYMNRNGISATEEFTLYRGTWSESPIMLPLEKELVNCQFMSSSKSRDIAKEFQGKKGYLHILHIKPGVMFYDLAPIYGEDKVKREKEVLIYPGMKLTLTRRCENTFSWVVSPP